MNLCDDIILFRKGQLSREELTKRYPEFQCKKGWTRYNGIEDAVSFIIPPSCPLVEAAQIIVNSECEPFDKCLVDHISWKMDYCPEWGKLEQIGKLSDICAYEEQVEFRVWLREKDFIDIRYCIKRGDYGDEDGFGMEPDTWLVARLNQDGTWRKPWFIEE